MKEKPRKHSTGSAHLSLADNTVTVNIQPPRDGGTTSADVSTDPVLPGQGSNQSDVPCACTAKFTATHRRAIVGSGLLVVGAVSWVGVSMCGKNTIRWPEFCAPYFVVYLSGACTVLVYPLYIGVQILASRGRMQVKEAVRDSLRVFREEGLGSSPYKAFGKCFGFCLLWTLASYVYLRALSFKSFLDVIALFATNSNFVYLMSWIVLQKKFIAIRIVAFIVAMTGIIIITYMDSGFASQEMWGSVLAMVATGSAAAYKVLFRRLLGDITYDQVACFLTGLGVCHIVTMWPIFLLLYFTEVEPLSWSRVPWDMVAGALLFALVLNFVLQFGAIVTYHLLVQASFIFAIPVSIAALYVFEGHANVQIRGLQIGAYFLIVSGFLLNILPENWSKKMLTLLPCKRTEADDNHVTSHMTPRQHIRSISDVNNSTC